MTDEPDLSADIDMPQKKRAVRSRKIRRLPPKLEFFVNQVLINDEMPIERRFDLLALEITFGIGVFGLIFYSIKGSSYLTGILFATLLLSSGTVFLLYVFKGWIKRSYILHTVCNTIIFIPCFFYLMGGIFTAALPILILGLVWPLCFTIGKKTGIIFFGTVLLYTALIFLNISFPEMFPTPDLNVPESMVGVVWTLIIAVIISIILIVKSSLYEKQRKHIEAHESEMRTVMHRLKEADSAKNKFLATMSHEIRTPMNSIIGMNQLILRESTDKNIQKYAAVIDHDSKGLLSIINEILDLSRINGGNVKIRREPYDLRDILLRCGSQMYPLILEKKLKSEHHINQDIPSNLVGDAMRIQQVIVNLLSNAVKYTEEGTVTFSLDYTRNSASSINLIISVSDTGIGIAEENIPKIFSPFLRIDYAKNYIQGTGLGLSITKEIVDGMKGSIAVESTLGVGSTFTVTIPQKIHGEGVVGVFDSYSMVPAGAAVQETDVPLKSYVPLFVCPSLKILVVDDVASNILVFRSLLKETKARVDTAASGAECLKRAAESAYDIIFLDIMMPEMTGDETLQRLRNLSENRSKDAPVIALTANALVGSRREYIRKGFTDYLSKPIDGSDLEAMIQKYVPKVSSAVSASESAAAESVPSGDVPSQLQKFEGINGLSPMLGLTYCGNDADTYCEVLRLFADENYLDRISDSFASEDWKTYHICMHTLKNTALTVGAEPLSKLAKELETAAMKNDIPAVMANHTQMMHIYSELLNNMKEAFGDFS